MAKVTYQTYDPQEKKTRDFVPYVAQMFQKDARYNPSEFERTETFTPREYQGAEYQLERSPYINMNYRPSENVENLYDQYHRQRDALGDLKYDSKYADDILSLVEKIGTSNEKSDLDVSHLYDEYKNDYLKLADVSAGDTASVAEGLTGGYGNSYVNNAVAQGNQIYKSHMRDILPTLMEIENNTDLINTENDYNVLNALNTAEANEYQRYRDTVTDQQNALLSLANYLTSEESREMSSFQADRAFMESLYENAETRRYNAYNQNENRNVGLFNADEDRRLQGYISGENRAYDAWNASENRALQKYSDDADREYELWKAREGWKLDDAQHENDFRTQLNASDVENYWNDLNFNLKSTSGAVNYMLGSDTIDARARAKAEEEKTARDRDQSDDNGEETDYSIYDNDVTMKTFDEALTNGSNQLGVNISYPHGEKTWSVVYKGKVYSFDNINDTANLLLKKYEDGIPTRDFGNKKIKDEVLEAIIAKYNLEDLE